MQDTLVPQQFLACLSASAPHQCLLAWLWAGLRPHCQTHPLQEHFFPALASLAALLRLPTKGDTSYSLGSGAISQEVSHSRKLFSFLRFCSLSSVGTFPILFSIYRLHVGQWSCRPSFCPHEGICPEVRRGAWLLWGMVLRKEENIAASLFWPGRWDGFPGQHRY